MLVGAVKMFLITSVICKNADTQICELTHVSADVKFIIINFFILFYFAS